MTKQAKTPKSFDHYATTKLWAAVGDRDEVALKKALSQGANPNATGTKGLAGSDPVLLKAVQCGDDVAIRVLLRAGARMKAGRDGITPLIAAATLLKQDPNDHNSAVYSLVLEKTANVFATTTYWKKPWVVVELLEAFNNEGVDPYVQRALDETLAKVSRKTWPEGASESALIAAVKFATPATFESLLGSGAHINLNERPFVGLAGEFQQRTTSSKMPQEQQDAWWDVLAKHPFPQGDMSLSAEQQAAENLSSAKSRALEKSWEPVVLPTRKGPRF